jgi:pectate lyase
MKTETTLFKIIALTTILVCFGICKAAAQTGGFANVSIGGTRVTVTNASQLLDYISRSSQYTIHVNGTIYLSGMNKVASNKAILGVGTSARIVGGGLNIAGVSNVVVQNISFSDWNDDAINLQDGSTNIWIDHCSFSNGYDGCVDIKRGSDYVTVSWNHFYNHSKTCLLGHSDNNGSQDSGHLRITYHHNYFEGTGSRHPRVRFSALCHVYNNYYKNNDYGVASTCDAEVLVEGNYFQNVDDPTLVGYGSSWDGDLEQRNNIFSSSGYPETRGSVSNPPYSYTLENTSSIPTIVSSGAGANGTTGDRDDSDGTSAGDGTFNGIYSIVASHSGKAFDLYNFRTSDGSNIVQWYHWGSESQQFVITPVDGIWHKIEPVLTPGKVLDISGVSASNGANLQIWEYWAGANQQFRFQDAGSGVWRIIARHSQKCIDVAGASQSDGANVLQWTCNANSRHQMFELIKLN